MFLKLHTQRATYALTRQTQFVHAFLSPFLDFLVASRPFPKQLADGALQCLKLGQQHLPTRPTGGHQINHSACTTNNIGVLKIIMKNKPSKKNKHNSGKYIHV